MDIKTSKRSNDEQVEADSRRFYSASQFFTTYSRETFFLHKQKMKSRQSSSLNFIRHQQENKEKVKLKEKKFKECSRSEWKVIRNY